VVFAQNPWALVTGLKRTWPEKGKAKLQRLSYRFAMKKAAFMIFNSEYMRHTYQRNAGEQERASKIVYQALDDETHVIAAHMRTVVVRNPLQILCVSAMAPHKGVETVVNALELLRSTHGISARLVLVGAWPDTGYQREIQGQITRLGLSDAVDIEGHVSRERLEQIYAESRVFCLMSHCESFGIPAVEAQAFGTPVVSSNCCAIPEVCGEGGYYPDPGDAEATAAYLARLLNDASAWRELSQKAIDNASRYRWDQCSRGMLEMFDHV
jgi:glycosyltransferase involved in cell wall biosynthesis